MRMRTTKSRRKKQTAKRRNTVVVALLARRNAGAGKHLRSIRQEQRILQRLHIGD